MWQWILGVSYKRRVNEYPNPLPKNPQMNVNNPVIALCMAGSRAELEGWPGDAYALYVRAWDAGGSEPV